MNRVVETKDEEIKSILLRSNSIVNLSIRGEGFSRWYLIVSNSVPRSSIIDESKCTSNKEPTAWYRG